MSRLGLYDLWLAFCSEDWDFEWRALTWLPAYAEEACLLTAAVELGRSCASLASGGRDEV